MKTDPNLTQHLAELTELATQAGAEGVWLIRGAASPQLRYYHDDPTGGDICPRCGSDEVSDVIDYHSDQIDRFTCDKCDFVWGGETYQGDHPALVDEETFSIVQNLLDDTASGGSKNRHSWLLAGLLWSAQYHARMTGSLSRGKYAYYRAKGPGPEHAIPAADLETRAIGLLKTIRGTSHLAPESWRLALAIAPTVAALWDLLTTDPERKALLNLVFLPHGLIIEPGGAISQIHLHDGFSQP